MADALTFIMENIPLIAIAIGVPIVLIYLFKGKGHSADEPPKEIDPDKEKEEWLLDVIKTTGTVPGFKSELIQGSKVIGRIEKIADFHFEKEFELKKNINLNTVKERIRNILAQRKAELNGEAVADFTVNNFYALIFTNGFMWHVFYVLFGYGKKMALLPKDYFDHKDYRDKLLTSNAQLYRETKNIWICEEYARDVLSGISYHMECKQMEKSTVNRIPLIQYHDMKTPKFAARAREVADVRHKDWKRKENQLEPDVEEENDLL